MLSALANRSPPPPAPAAKVKDSLELQPLPDGFVRLVMSVRLTRERAYAVIEALQDR